MEMETSSLVMDSFKSLNYWGKHNFPQIFENIMWTLEANLQVGSYAWLTYQEVYDAALKMGSAMRSRGVNPVSFQHSLLSLKIIALESVNNMKLII